MSQTAYSTGMHYMEDFVTISTVLKANSQRPNFTVVVVAFFFRSPDRQPFLKDCQNAIIFFSISCFKISAVLANYWHFLS